MNIKTINLCIEGAAINIICGTYELTFQGNYVAWFKSYSSALDYAYSEFAKSLYSL
jgi:hypothetical protein